MPLTVRWISNGFLGAFIFCIQTSLTYGQSSLPKQVQADIVYQEISDAIRENAPDRALAGITRYRALGATMPIRLLFVEVKLALITGDVIRSETSLSEYLRVSNTSDSNYTEAIRIYPEIHRKAEGARQVRTNSEREAAAQRAEQERIQTSQKEEARLAASAARWNAMTPAERDEESKETNKELNCVYAKSVAESARGWLQYNETFKKSFGNYPPDHQAKKSQLKEKERRESEACN